MSSKTKMQSTMLRAALLRSLAYLCQEGLADTELTECIRQALDARSMDDVQDWFDTWPLERS